MLNYIEKGEGDAIILLHGNGEDSTYFENQIDPLSRHFRVIAVDSPGHGKSPRGEGEFTLSRFADDIKQFMDEMGIRDANLLGFSDGGNIALIFALRYPEMVKKLILNGANLYPMGLKTEIYKEIIRDWNRARRNPNLKREEELLNLMVKEPNIKPKELGKIKSPALVIVGDKDLIRRKHSKMIADSLANGSFSEIPGDHFIAYYESDLFNKVALDFLLS